MCSEPDGDWSIEDAVCGTVIYADLFDFAVTSVEIDRDLLFVDAPTGEVERALHLNLQAGRLVARGGFVTLPNRSALVEVRRLSSSKAIRLWPFARRFGAILATIPFVRMVGVTGSLAVENPRNDADVDYLLVVQPNRLWLARAGAIAVVRWARERGVTLCPNYLLASSVLRLDRRDLYTAHELLQMVPLNGRKTYHDLIAENAWSSGYLPHRARLTNLPARDSTVRRVLRSAGEAIVVGPLAERLDRWEWQRKARRLLATGTRAQFSRDVCEGHYGHHRDAILGAFDRRCKELGIRGERLAGVGG